uniref:ATPase AAA-type core domain-containing protein n=1 Tax=viral metagenome TaxID=1070528 RepID=A0A6C0E279_9ZZZZ
MTKESKTQMTKSEPKRRSKRIEENARKKKYNKDSSDEDSDYHSSDSEEEMDMHEYRKFLHQLFPSKHLKNKVKMGEKIKEMLQKNSDTESYEDEEDEDEEEPEQKIVKKSKTKTPQKKSTKKQKNIESESDEDESEYYSEEDEYEEVRPRSPSKKKYNIIFTIGNVKDAEEYDDDYDEDDWETADEDESDTSTENEDDPVSTDTDTDNTSYSSREKEQESEEEDKINKRRVKKTKTKLANTDEHVSTSVIPKEKIDESNRLLQMLKDLFNEVPENSHNGAILNECIKVCEEKINHSKKKAEKKVKKQKEKNERIFRKILSDKNAMNDFNFFNKMEIADQIKIIKELREVNRITRIEKPYRMTLLESDIPTVFKANAMKKVSSLRYMEPGSGEFYKIKNWVDTFMRIPFGKLQTLPVNINDGVETCHTFMENAKQILDQAVYGLNDAKMQIMQMLGQLITNPESVGTAIAIQGPMGTGKTTLVKEGISKILNRPFAFIALGGATDSSFLEGHSYTYEGSTWGKIVQIIIDSKCMNPVIYFDELDKISDTPKGEEIAGILTHLTDTSQNTQFHDKYFSEIDFDLSKCLFIFSYNDESKVNPILRDRMYRIQTKGYERKQKIIISNQHLLPKIREQVKFDTGDIIIPDEAIQYMVDNYCSNEQGVRNLKRCLEIVHTKLNLYRLMKPGSNLFEEDMSIQVSFPFTVTKEMVDKLIKRNKDENYLFRTMYI